MSWTTLETLPDPHEVVLVSDNERVAVAFRHKDRDVSLNMRMDSRIDGWTIIWSGPKGKMIKRILKWQKMPQP